MKKRILLWPWIAARWFILLRKDKDGNGWCFGFMCMLGLWLIYKALVHAYVLCHSPKLALTDWNTYRPVGYVAAYLFIGWLTVALVEMAKKEHPNLS